MWLKQTVCNIILCILPFTMLLAQQTTPVNSAKKGKVLFFDDFKSAQLDRTKWNAEITGTHFNDELQAYVDSAATFYIENNILVLQPHFTPGFLTKDGQKFDFISARLNTMNKFDFRYGSAEARIKMSDAIGIWPAWWMLGYNDWPATGEIDIMEYVGEADWVSSAVHGPGYSGETPFVNRLYLDKHNDVTRWHVYAVDWTPESLIFKFDGKPMFRVNKTMAQHYGKWAFDTNKFLILNFALGGAYPVKINGVKTPYFGMPASTAELIKKSLLKMYVDWVKVTGY